MRMTRDKHGVVHARHPVVGTLCYEDDGVSTDEAPTCLWCVVIERDRRGAVARAFDIESIP